MNKYIICSTKTWNHELINDFISRNSHDNIILIKNKVDLDAFDLKDYHPKYIFFIHWSWHISQEIFSNFECILFHMTDLPYGRGGSPLQNLILNNHKSTKISAIKVVEQVDAGPVYLKSKLNLKGSAEKVYVRATKLILKDMIPKIIDSMITPVEQTGLVTSFTRRLPIQSDFEEILYDSDQLEALYDFIRMLDAQGYPRAFIDKGKFHIEIFDANYNENNIKAKVIIKYANRK